MSTAFKVGSSISPIDEICETINKVTGVQLGTKQRAMVESRLNRYIWEKGHKDLDAYWAHFNKNRGTEIKELVSLLTTHHTFFFREFNHFEFINDKLLLQLVERARKRIDKKIRVWSAACSQGHEVYSLAMFFTYHLKNYPDVTFEIFGTDVDPQSIKIANNGVYRYADIKEVPMQYIDQHWARGTGEIKDFVKAKETLKNKVKFQVSNLMTMDGVAKNQSFDIIFCRNVFIYFKPADIKTITTNFLSNLEPGGHLFIGISENLNDLKLPLENLGMSIFRKPTTGSSTPPTDRSDGPNLSLQPKVRVICVDDSPSVLSILKKVLSQDGFEVVATASNGREAAEVIKKTPCDAVTLDIHMPEMNGIEYLQKHFSASHPPVIIVSSVSRDDVQNAHVGLKAGASDFVEKPTLANLKEVSLELKSKLRTAAKNKSQSKTITQADREFSRVVKIENPAKCKRVVFVGKDAILSKEIFQSWPEQNIETVFLFENGVELDRHNVSDFAGTRATKFDLTTGLLEIALGISKGQTLSLIALGKLDRTIATQLTKLNPAQFIIEENAANLALEIKNVDLIPKTSIHYNSTEFLSRVKG